MIRINMLVALTCHTVKWTNLLIGLSWHISHCPLLFLWHYFARLDSVSWFIYFLAHKCKSLKYTATTQSLPLLVSQVSLHLLHRIKWHRLWLILHYRNWWFILHWRLRLWYYNSCRFDRFQKFRRFDSDSVEVLLIFKFVACKIYGLLLDSNLMVWPPMLNIESPLSSLKLFLGKVVTERRLFSTILLEKFSSLFFDLI